MATLPSGAPLTHALLDAPRMHEALTRVVEASPPDLVFAYCSGMARFALEVPLRSHPFVVDMVDVDSLKWGDLATRTRGPMRWIYEREARTLRRFERLASVRARHTLVVSERERLALAKIAPEATISVMQNGVDVSAFAPQTPPMSRAIVVFCGVMDYGPNEEGVVWFARRVWPLVRRQAPDARFVIVGKGPRSLTRELAIKDHSIEVRGSVAAVQPELWRAAVSVAPLRVARGLQNKVLEALAAGLPVVITPQVAAGLPDQVLSGCAVAETEIQFADEVVALLRLSPEARRARARSAELESLAWSERLRPLEGLLRAAAK